MKKMLANRVVTLGRAPQFHCSLRKLRENAQQAWWKHSLRWK